MRSDRSATPPSSYPSCPITLYESPSSEGSSRILAEPTYKYERSKVYCKFPFRVKITVGILASHHAHLLVYRSWRWRQGRLVNLSQGCLCDSTCRLCFLSHLFTLFEAQMQASINKQDRLVSFHVVVVMASLK